MSAPITMHVTMRVHAENYLSERRRLGFGLRSTGYALSSFARYVDGLGDRGPLTVELMADWARRDKWNSDEPSTWARRLKKLRSFARYLQQFDPRTEVPDDSTFGRIGQRLAPHIYADQEIVELLAAARRLGPAPGLRGATYEALFGLIASTGLRVSEAVHLLDTDVDLKTGLLTVRQTKFAKSRHVPLHPSAVQALKQYRWLRNVMSRSRTRRRSSLVHEASGAVMAWVCARCIGSSPGCAINWAGSTAALTIVRASTT